jgi:prepilin-type N-terminal cleavage/methylation domain-containing protein/prepilin-type processing-associated H-X9-DG protein
MKPSIGLQSNHGFTLIELVVVLAVIAIFLAMIDFGPPGNAKARAQRIQCVNNLKQTGLAFRVWAGDNGDKYPMDVAQTNGGSAEFTTGLNAYRHFQVMSNELATPKVLLCPADWLNGSSISSGARIPAANFTAFNNSNLSYFVGIDAKVSNVTMFLSGDRNITSGSALKNGLLELTTNAADNWTSEVHPKMGNILFADGSVRQMSNSNLRAAIASTALATNRLQMPVLDP